MTQYTRKQLDEKIHSFLARKLQEYPELDTVDLEPKHSKRIMRSHTQAIHAFMPARLNIQL